MMRFSSFVAAILPCLLPICDAHAQAPKRKTPVQPDDAGAVVKREKLPARVARRIILPKVDFKALHVGAALQELEKLVAAAVPEAVPVEFPRSPEAIALTKASTITLSLENVPLGAVLSHIEAMSGLEFVEHPIGFAGEVFEKDSSASAERPPELKLTPLLAKAAKWRVPNVALKEKSMTDVVKALNEFARKADPKRKGIPIEMSKAEMEKREETPLTLTLADVPLLEVIKFVTILCNLRYAEKDGKIVLTVLKNPFAPGENAPK